MQAVFTRNYPIKWDVLSGMTEMAWDVLSRVAKMAWDVLSVVSKNGMGCFVSGLLTLYIES